MTQTRWINTAKQLGEDINARISCPNCGSKQLTVLDAPFDNEEPTKGGERHIKCRKCGASTAVLYRIAPVNWMEERENS